MTINHYNLSDKQKEYLPKLKKYLQEYLQDPDSFYSPYVHNTTVVEMIMRIDNILKSGLYDDYDKEKLNELGDKIKEWNEKTNTKILGH